VQNDCSCHGEGQKGHQAWPNLHEELRLGVPGAEQHGAGPRGPRRHGEDQGPLCQDHPLLARRHTPNELAVMLVVCHRVAVTERADVFGEKDDMMTFRFVNSVNNFFIALF